MQSQKRNLAFFCRVGARLCAFPCADIVEVMRRLPIDPVAGAPSFVSGISIVRDIATPVVDLAALLGADASEPGYFVMLALPGRQVAVAVDAVLGVRPLSVESEELPPLIRGAAPEFVSAMRTLDNALLLVLGGVLDVPAEMVDLAG